MTSLGYATDGDECNTLSKSADVCSRQVSVVCDLGLRPGPVLCGRPRTAANETRTETGVASVPKGFKSIRDSLSATAPTWAFSMSRCYVIQDHPVHIP